jgi:hypothetical protein
MLATDASACRGYRVRVICGIDHLVLCVADGVYLPDFDAHRVEVRTYR